MEKGTVSRCDCGHDAVSDGFTTGYGTDSEGKTSCFACCGLLDAARLVQDGKMTGYFAYDKNVIPYKGRQPYGARFGDLTQYLNAHFTNWPGTFKVPVYYVRRSVNNFGAERLDFWFTFQGSRYWGVNVGDNQVARVKRVKG